MSFKFMKTFFLLKNDRNMPSNLSVHNTEKFIYIAAYVENHLETVINNTV